MTDFLSTRDRSAGDDEPARDTRLAALLRDVIGDAPVGEVNWDALAERIAVAVREQHSAPWWSYAERWQRRAIPFALAAGIVGALALVGAARADSAPNGTTADIVSAVVGGTSSSDAASSFAGSVTSAVDLAVGVPE